MIHKQARPRPNASIALCLPCLVSFPPTAHTSIAACVLELTLTLSSSPSLHSGSRGVKDGSVGREAAGQGRRRWWAKHGTAAPSMAAASRKGGHKIHSSSSSARAAVGGGGGGGLPTLVLDNGADRLKVGFAGEPAPRFLMPNGTAKLKGQVQVRESGVGWLWLREGGRGRNSFVAPRVWMVRGCMHACWRQCLVWGEKQRTEK